MDDRHIVIFPWKFPFEPPASEHCFIRVLQRTPKNISLDMLVPTLAAGLRTGLLSHDHGHTVRMLPLECLSHLFEPTNHRCIAIDHRHTRRADQLPRH